MSGLILGDFQLLLTAAELTAQALSPFTVPWFSFICVLLCFSTNILQLLHLSCILPVLSPFLSTLFIFSSLSFCHSPDVLPVCFSPTDGTFSVCVPVFGYTIYTDTNLKQYHTHCPVCVWLVYLSMGTPADDEKRCKICIFAFLFQFLYLFLHHVSHLHFCLSACVCLSVCMCVAAYVCVCLDCIVLQI